MLMWVFFLLIFVCFIYVFSFNFSACLIDSWAIHISQSSVHEIHKAHMAKQKKNWRVNESDAKDFIQKIISTHYGLRVVMRAPSSKPDEEKNSNNNTNWIIFGRLKRT